MDICLTLSEINWSLTKDVFSIVGTVGALALGFIGLTTWKRQLKGTSEYELAKKAILITYQIRQSIQSVRNPIFLLSREEDEAGNRIQERQRIYNERMQKLLVKYAELKTIRLEAMVVWSDPAHNSFNEIEKIISKLDSAIFLHLWMMQGANTAPGLTVDNSPARIAENDKIIYFQPEMEDEFTVEINEAVDTVEVFFQSRVRGK